MIQRNDAEGRYEAVEDGRVVGIAEFVERDGVMVLPRTVVPPEFGGRGIAGELVRRALDDARERGLRVVPTCSYVAAWIERHPEYADLVAAI